MGVLDRVLSILYPPTCYACGQDGEAGDFCAACAASIRPITPPWCSICGLPFSNRRDPNHLCGDCLRQRPHFDRARACVVYDAHDDASVLRTCIHIYKYQRRAELAPPLAKLLKQLCPFDLKPYDRMLPVPLHLQRLRWRGFNQSLLLGRPLGRAAGMIVDPYCLVRTRPTQPQVELSGSQRRDNVRRAFAVDHPEAVRDRRILLVDDVMTTGATVDECAKVLKRNGAASVDVLVLARAVVQ